MRVINRAICCAGSAALLSACAPEDQAPRQDPVAAAPHLVSLAADEYAFTAPDTILAGWTTFRMSNHGEEVHYGHIVQLDSGKTVEDLVNGYVEAIRSSGPRPKWLKRFGGPGGTAPGGMSSVTQYLEAGSYVWLCPIEDSTGPPHLAKGEVKPFVVRSEGQDAATRAAAPQADMTVGLTDFSFTIETPLRAGRHMVRVENTGVEPHDLVMMRLAPGRTIDDLRAWMNPERARRDNQPDEPPPPLESLGAPAGGIAAIAPGMEGYFETDLATGEYALMCMATAPDGRSHIEHGMIRQVTVE